MPVPLASAADHVLHVILSRIAVESPDSGQPELHAGRYSMVPLISWPWARNVLVPVSEAVTLGEAGRLVGVKAGPLGDAAEPEAEAGADAAASSSRHDAAAGQLA